jgi:putative ABC transport system ATP-binding protein
MSRRWANRGARICGCIASASCSSDSRDRHTRSAMLLEQVGLDDRARHRPHQLSGGQMQRVAIARALANRPELVIADEPTGELDHATGRQIMEVFGALRDKGITVILATHNPEVAEMTDRILHLRDGRLTT